MDSTSNEGKPLSESYTLIFRYVETFPGTSPREVQQGAQAGGADRFPNATRGEPSPGEVDENEGEHPVGEPRTARPDRT